MISYAHENSSHRDRIKALADLLRTDGVRCELDQYADAPQQGWPSWMADKILDNDCFVLVVSSPSYVRRWRLAERAGVGLGAKYEGRLIRQALYSQEGLNSRVIPVILKPNDTSHIPPELQDSIRYEVDPAPGDLGYDALLRRLTHQPAASVPTLGEPAVLLEKQEAAVASAFYILQRVPAAFPVEVLCRATGVARDLLLSTAEADSPPRILHLHDASALTTTYYRPVHPVPTEAGELLGRALDALLVHVRQRGAHATSRDDIRNVLVLARADGVRPELVARVFERTQTAIKRLGDKRLVWHAATSSLEASRRESRQIEDAKAEALALICGQSWVLQRVNDLEKAEAVAKDSLALGRKLPWPRNTAFCHKCLGRLTRMRAEANSDSVVRESLLDNSEKYLLDAIAEFKALPDTDRHSEIGDCWSLLGRTRFVANRLEDAQAAAAEADSLLSPSNGKDYQDLQLLHGDLAARHDAQSAEDFYTAVIQHRDSNDAQYSEIRARAYLARARHRLTQGRRPQAKRDFEAAARIWRHLQDPAASDAAWGALTCSDLPMDQDLLESKAASSAVRVRAVRIHEGRVASMGRVAARRAAQVTEAYVDRILAEAESEVAIDEVDWVSRIASAKIV